MLLSAASFHQGVCGDCAYVACVVGPVWQVLSSSLDLLRPWTFRSGRHRQQFPSLGRALDAE